MPIQSIDNLVLFKTKSEPKFEYPYLVSDIEMTLKFLQKNPAPLERGSKNLSDITFLRIGKEFQPISEGLEKLDYDRMKRARSAHHLIDVMKFTEIKKRDKKAFLSISERGREWIGFEREKKLQFLFDQSPIALWSRPIPGVSYDWLDGETLYIPIEAINEELFHWVNKTFMALTAPMLYNKWLESASAFANPFICMVERNPEMAKAWTRRYATPTLAYQNILIRTMLRLLSLGALSWSGTDISNFGIELTSIGRFLYLMDEDWRLPKAEKDQAIISADFSVILLKPSPALVIALGGFAEKINSEGFGSFKITKLSVQEGIHHGLSAESILEILNGCAKVQLPANVVYEIKNWSQSKQSVKLSEAIFLEGSDPLTMAEIASRFKKDFQKISPLVLKYIGDESRTVLMTKLKKRGFFVE